MPGARETTKGPVVAPDGTVAVIDVALHALTVAALSLNKTTPFPEEAPKPVPEITTWPPIDPVVAETLVMAGAGFVAVVIEKLSMLPVYKAPVLPLLTASPTYTFCAMLMVWLVPTCAQFSPSSDWYPEKLLPLRTSFTQ